MEAEEETDAFFMLYGLYISKDGKYAHMTQLDRRKKQGESAANHKRKGILWSIS